MYRRRDIREAAVQFLYFTDLESGPDAALMEDAFWEMTQEESMRKLIKARRKAFLHVAQGRVSRLTKLQQHAENLLAKWKADPSSEPLSIQLSQLLKQESQLNHAIDLLKLAKPGDDDISALNEPITQLRNTNSSVTRLRSELLESLQDFPQWKIPAEGLVAAIHHLDRVSERFTAIDDPSSTLGDFAHIRKSSSELSSFRHDTQKLVQGTLAHKGAIDAALDQNIENYAPERIAPVDRAIMRLAAHEILHCDDIPKAVSINEAVEIAKRFSTSESSRFINGVLDAIQG